MIYIKNGLFYCCTILILAACSESAPSNNETSSVTDADSSTSTAGNAQRRILRIGMSQYPATLHPNIETMVAKFYALGMLSRSVTSYDADWNLVCNLCVTLPTLENGMAVLEKTPDGKDGIAVTFTLPENASWGDGTPLTANDLLFSWRVGRNTKTGANNIDMYRRTYAFDVLDDHTFVLHLDKVVFDYNQLGQFFPLPQHLEEDIFKEDPYEYRHRTTYNADAKNPGLWYGPYIISELAQGSYLRLIRNPHWYGKDPYFDEIELRAIQNTAAMEANILSGTIDMIAGELGLTLDQALSFKERHGDNYNVIFKPGLMYEHIEINLDNPILGDIRVRRAIMYGIDRQIISDRLFSGMQPVAHSSISPLGNNASKNITRYNYNPDTANQLLNEAGWDQFKDGIRVNAAQKPLRIEIMTTAGDKTRELVEQVLQNQLKQIGIDLRIKNEAARVFFGQTTRQRDFSAMAMFAWTMAPDNVPRTTMHSSEIPTKENNYAGQNYSGINLAELDQLIENLEGELSSAKRTPMWERFQQIYTEELPIFPLYWRSNAFILPKWLKGLRPTGHLDASTLRVEDWTRAE